MIITAASKLLNSCSQAPDRKETLSPVSRAVDSIRYLLGIPGRVRDLVTKPLAEMTASAGIYATCRLFEWYCSRQAYQIADKILEEGERVRQNSPEVVQQAINTSVAIHNTIPVVGRLISFGGACLYGSGWASRKVSEGMNSLSNSIHRTGQNLGESNSLINRTLGTFSRGGSYVISGLSCIPSTFGRVESFGYSAMSAGDQLENFNIRKSLAENLLPLIQKMNRMLLVKSIQTGYNIAAGTGLCYAAGSFDAAVWLNASSRANNATLALKGGLLAWTYGPIIKNGVQLGLACNMRKRQVEKLSQAIARDPDLAARLGWTQNSLKTDFLASLLIEKSSLLLGCLFNNPEEWIDGICNHSEPLVRMYSLGRDE